MQVFQDQPAFIVTNKYAVGSSLNTKVQTMLQAGKQDEKRIFQQNIDSLLRSSRPKAMEETEEQQTAESKSEEDKPHVSAFTLKDEALPGFISNHLKKYRDHTEETADNLIYYRETINYLQECVDETQKTLAGKLPDDQRTDVQIRLEAYQLELDNSYSGVSEMLDSQLSSAKGFVNFVRLAYGDEIYGKLSDVIGDLLAQTKEPVYNLHDAGRTTGEVTGAIDRTVAALRNLSVKIADRYRKYTGKQLSAYERTETESITQNARKFVDEHLLFDYEQDSPGSSDIKQYINTAARYTRYNEETEVTPSLINTRA